jgi:hypothetical protein
VSDGQASAVIPILVQSGGNGPDTLTDLVPADGDTTDGTRRAAARRGGVQGSSSARTASSAS